MLAKIAVAISLLSALFTGLGMFVDRFQAYRSHMEYCLRQADDLDAARYCAR